MTDKVLSGKVAGVRIGASDSLERRRSSANAFDQVVVTGVAASSAPMELKKLRADSAGNVTVYEVSPGVEITLTDNGLQVMLRAAAQAKEKQLAAQAPPPPPAAPAPKAALNSITWIDKRGHVMVLRGTLSKIELEALRQRLPEEQR
jgi:hypothetical protein